MSALIYALTDENPEIRYFCINQKLRTTLLPYNGAPLSLMTEGMLKGFKLEDTNDFVTLCSLF